MKALLPDNDDLKKMENEEDDMFEDAWCDLKDETKYAIKSGEDDGIDDGKICVGVEIASPSDDGGLECSNCDLDDLKKKVEKLRVKLNVCENEKIKIMSGVS